MSKKVNKDLEITSVCCTLYLCTKIISYSIFLLSIERLLTGVFHFKTSRLGFSFLSTENLYRKIIQFRFFQSDFHLSSYRMTVEIRLFQSRNSYFNNILKNPTFYGHKNKTLKYYNLQAQFQRSLNSFPTPFTDLFSDQINGPSLQIYFPN